MIWQNETHLIFREQPRNSVCLLEFLIDLTESLAPTTEISRIAFQLAFKGHKGRIMFNQERSDMLRYQESRA
jgi:hypothetical protein